MHIVLAGASGATGRKVIEQAVADGHRVTALVREGARFDPPEGVEPRIADTVNDAELALPQDADAVISCLGMRPKSPNVPVCEPATRNLIAAMLRAGIPRIVVTSAVPAYSKGTGEPLWFRTVRSLVHRSMPYIYADIEAMEKVLRTDDSVAWTILRPGYLKDGGRTDYQLLAERNATTSASREDVAHALLALAETESAAGCAYGIQRGKTRAPRETR